MQTQTQNKRNAAMPNLTYTAAKSSRAIEGAVSRMSTASNRTCDHYNLSSPVDFGQWGDWDNGHSDG